MDLLVAYLSRALTGPELNYLTTEKEFLAMLYAISKFRPYLYGRKFTLMSDHEPLKWIPSELPTGCSLNAPTTNFKVLSCRENLTYFRNNYVNFLSADVEITTPVGRLLIDIGAIDPQELKNKQPKIGEVLITPRGQYNVYLLIKKTDISTT